MSAAEATTGRTMKRCAKCHIDKGMQAFAVIALDAREVSEFAATVDPTHTRRDDICRACRGDEKRAASRDRVKSEAGMTITQINKAKASPQISIVPSPAETSTVLVNTSPSANEKHDRASDTPDTPPAPEPPPARDTVDLEAWLASDAPGAFRCNAVLIVRDPHYPGNYWLYVGAAGYSPQQQVPGSLVSYVAHLLSARAPEAPMKGFVYA